MHWRSKYEVFCLILSSCSIDYDNDGFLSSDIFTTPTTSDSMGSRHHKNKSAEKVNINFFIINFYKDLFRCRC